MAKVSVFCPCSERLTSELDDTVSLELSSFPETITDPNTLHIQPDLNFCNQCQAVRCRKCIELEVVTKYCARCLHEMKPEYSFCSRNCLDCPICGNNLIVLPNKNTMTCSMSCSTCDYIYTSEPLERLRPMARVVKTEQNKRESMRMFSDLQKFYLQQRQLELGNEDIPKSIVTEYSKMKVKEYGIYEFMRRSTVRALDEETVESFARLANNESILSYDIGLGDSSRFKSEALPLQTKLRCKYAKRCKACRSSLMKPDHDPTSVKFYKLSNAIDTLPSIRVYPNPNNNTDTSMTPGSIASFVVVVQNALDSDINVNLSAYTELPGGFHQVQLPKSSFTLHRKPESHTKLEVLIDCTPSIELSRGTKASRVALMNRPVIDYSDDDMVYEHRQNYIVVPMKVVIHENSQPQTTVKVPILVSFKGEDVAVAFWCVLELGQCCAAA
ncbi:uncharacterized protein CYBJADRAFT_56386 [Cyberlindnera jadinii NRRL Y-1542]|uniref:Dynactin subunit 4 n=1 Tax=Cyberlindnera jadinii (strain ATCC 18201 / CBS 1600 / BCRC 20928 / JCM 3617 / NBRC 0987 / NRRL Y-1542) TaxID=983966 RepID=A0A1E4RUW2_CYBJN|nr:hypothetical protein CYBJADRAFT_56386 [Cyberlindnera jadinii NRRL Y-1542]ODV70855.1 hypothetical protein CYBJADRAFT_56386 [Cyberlindnera jadinii NRRL Y-1542]